MRILVADDDKKLCDVIKRGLEEESYAVDCVYNGGDALYYAESTSYDLIVLDIMMTEKNGIDVCKEIKKKKINTAILMLTAKDTVEDRVKGLDTGADDYLIKPFAFSELVARVRALLRRESGVKSTIVSTGDLSIDTTTRLVSWKGKQVDLTSKEYTILHYFMRQPNVVITRTMIEDHAWDYEFDSISNIVDVYIKRIRNKIDPKNGKQIIQTIRGAGYRLVAP